MSASLVGSEMCIRDRPSSTCFRQDSGSKWGSSLVCLPGTPSWRVPPRGCLLYTSDAADDM
eukprot:3215734-Alexandrium_andersonii.AAC.1